MNKKTFGALLVVGFVAWAVTAFSSRPPLYATPINGSGPTDLIALTMPQGEHRQQLVLVDPVRRVLGVYQVDPTSGEVALRSVRNVTWDLQMTEFNCAVPLPREIRSVVEQR
jgi:hypothetical protein